MAAKKKKEETTIEAPVPTFKAVALVKIPDAPSSEGYVAVTVTIKGSEIINIESSEPNLKNIAIEQAKINFVKTFLSDED
jgi:hypothetical protein